MRKPTSLLVAIVVGGWGLMAPALFLPAPPAAAQESASFGGLPPGLGQEDVFYTCQACHSLRLVLQQRLPRWEWEHTLEWMVEEQGMPELEAEELDRILDYLAAHLGRESPR